MSDHDLLAPLTALARDLGGQLADRERTAPARALPELTAAFETIDRLGRDALRPQLSRLCPQAGWADEFDTRLPDSGEVWVADTMDGAVQYMQGIDLWCVTIALVRDREPVAAVLHCPPLGETYAAAAGHGATRNGAPIRPAAKTDLAAALVATSHPPYAHRQPEAVDRAGRSYAAVIAHAAAVRNLGPTSWQLADTAAGRLDAFWLYGVDDLNLLAGALIAREAGALVTDAAGDTWAAGADSILAAGPQLHSRLAELLI